MIKKVFLFTVIPILFSALLCYADDGDGGYAGAFLRMGLGARALGMGGAFTGVADDGFASSYNPAGIIQLENPVLSASYRLMDLDRKLSYISYHQSIKGGAAIGGYWINSGVGDVETRDDRGEITGELTNYENAIDICFAKRVIKELTLGVNIRYSQYNLANLNAYTMGVDYGMMFFPVAKLRLGLAVQNIGMRYSWVSSKYWQEFDKYGTDTDDNFPVNFRVGGSYLFLKDKLLFSMDMEKNSKQDTRLHLGAEYRALENLAGRVGYDDGSLALGLGINYQLRSVMIAIDYAYLSNDVELNPDHILAMSLEFTGLFK